MSLELEPWRSDAVCRGSKKNYWFPEVGRMDDIRKAKAICDSCPVRIECLNWALKHEDHGVWGGMTAEEREGVRRKRRRIAQKRAKASR